VTSGNLAARPRRLRRQTRPTVELGLRAGPGLDPVGVIEAASEKRRRNPSANHFLDGEQP
jgi:hypothetical protein